MINYTMVTQTVSSYHNTTKSPDNICELQDLFLSNVTAAQTIIRALRGAALKHIENIVIDSKDRRR
jgi:hypothetical protein